MEDYEMDTKNDATFAWCDKAGCEATDAIRDDDGRWLCPDHRPDA